MTPVRAGDPAPEFEASDGDGKTWRLADLRGKRVVLYFYPADFTPGCTREACDFRDHHSAFVNAGYVVLGVSDQDEETHRRFAREHALPFPLLADVDLRIADSYGARRERQDAYEGIPLRVARATFVIDEHGIVRRAQYDVSVTGHVQGLRDLEEI